MRRYRPCEARDHRQAPATASSAFRPFCVPRLPRAPTSNSVSRLSPPDPPQCQRDDPPPPRPLQLLVLQFTSLPPVRHLGPGWLFAAQLLTVWWNGWRESC
ncbi:hypothetical protein NDU88_003778 [Pleurodeles waltl]|uniref:Uncharacterized protein n=1 Tax=Pleurodeles waltl TaxID=8319 RepID=A0AAV7TPJ3_PLEWA|nr:hypothetical protein NDU88_003778 [Pleurodeles waltl]